MLNMPQRVVVQLVGETDETVFKAKLRAEITEALMGAYADVRNMKAEDISNAEI